MGARAQTLIDQVSSGSELAPYDRNVRIEGFDDNKEKWLKYWNTLTGDVKHKFTECLKKVSRAGFTDNPEAFCAKLKDFALGTTAWRGGEMNIRARRLIGRSISEQARTTATRPGTLELYPFSSTDWYGYAGAEKFNDGDEPLIGYASVDESDWPETLEDVGEGLSVEIIVDRNGVQVVGDRVSYAFDVQSDIRKANIEMVAKGIMIPVNVNDLERQGFRRIL